MELAVLGPVELAGGAGAELNGTMVRRLAAALALSPHGLPFDGLVDALWAEEPPPSARKTLQGFVHRLRRSLGAEALVRTVDGYRLEPGLVELDVHAFDRDLDEAAALDATGRCEDALARADAALRLWRGIPFVELGDLPAAVAERARLEERLRLGEELRAQLALGLGARARSSAISRPWSPARRCGNGVGRC